MAHDEGNDARLLSLLEPKAADDLPPGYRWGKLRDAGVFGPLVEHRLVSRGKKVVDANAAENAKLIRAWDSIRWPVLKFGDPDAIAEWSRKALEVEQFQKKLGAPSVNTAKPDSDAETFSRKIAR